MKKVIFLVDMNAFYISCEMTRNKELRGVPAAVAGDPKKRTGIILAANYEARAYGVKTAMVLQDALRLCPNMKLVPPDHNFYEQKSREVMEILSSYTPVLQQNSIDEAWLDMTGCEGLFGKPVEAARSIMNNIRNELGLWCSIGISENKFLAKMASELKKPLGITELWREDIQQKLWPLQIEFMHGIGKQTSKKLRAMGINTIGELARFNQKTLFKVFGKTGIDMYARANRIDDSCVQVRDDNDIKSIGRSVTLPEDVTSIEKAKIVLMKLADEVGMTARRHDKKGRTVQITLKYTDFKTITRQKTVPATYLTKEIYSAGVDLLEKNWNQRKPVRLIGISISGFDEKIEFEQMTIMDLLNMKSSGYISEKTSLNTANNNLDNNTFNEKTGNEFGNEFINDKEITGREDTHLGLSEKEERAKEERLEKVLDELREKHGYSKVTRAIFIKESS
ncbi:MAG: DNA polymerase IV [Clostridiaceae bacterium]|nr:DNA polymerase IV [Clostridiaceae bacterium]